jgi:bacteriocin biosynthesis cyclodehydratase domain-containing protein
VRPVRPVLKSGLRRAWRSPSSLQIGLDPGRAVVLDGVDLRVLALLDSLDGTRDHDEVVQAAVDDGLGSATVRRLLDVLATRGLLDDAARDTRALRVLSPAERDRLAPDVLSLSLAGPDPEVPADGLDAVERRRGAVVEVRGCGRVGTGVAAALAAAGVGTVVPVDPQPTRHADRGPVGPTADDVGASRAEAARRAVRRAADVRTDPDPAAGPPDLVVLAPDGPDLVPDDTLVRTGRPHLAARVRETTGVVGPLVLPGRGACLRCLDLYRRDRDPAWPQVVAQLAATRGPWACDVLLATAVGTLAAMQAVAYLEGRPVDAYGGTLELGLADPEVRRRSWPVHPACGCGWPVPTATPGPPSGETPGPRPPHEQDTTPADTDDPVPPPAPEPVTMGA